MSRYIKIVDGTFEGFCGVVTDEGRDFCGVLTVLTECFGKKLFISSIREEWVVDIPTLTEWQKAQASRLTAR